MKNQKGVALITVLLVVALATAVSAALMHRQHLTIRSLSNQLQARQAIYYAQGGERLAMAILARDLRQGSVLPVDHPGEEWANPNLHFPLDDGGALTLHIEDMAGRFNLNSLAQRGVNGELALLRMQRLLHRLDLPEVYALRLKDWLDTDQNPSTESSSEDAQYLLAQPAYRTGSGEIADTSELRLLAGMTFSEYQRLEPFVSALPPETALNVNTASRHVLGALGEGIPEAVLQTLINGRDRDGYPDLNVIPLHLNEYGATTRGLAVSSQFFRVTTMVELGEHRQVLTSYVQRGHNGRVRLLARDLGQDAYSLQPIEDNKR
ncbi:general secretion pathway protein GspK [Aquipseudomonas alcaligenes]|uniref:Type II secretion system protein K n=1 Tax=Aquipseudomonas alcaligenes TaxID=43263 RepID=A0A2V4LQQ1_AQUAC|nr:type II secretion system minor pseudopilin GspK [Pseudomonas alcaligenes]PYC20236.1 general secretion pathway protein GspK [Pseudomonas alcaligenes]